MTLNSFDSQHTDLIHDAQLDYYGKKLATCSSDTTIRIFNILQGNQQQQVDTLVAHKGPVWQVAWAHPKYNNLLATCSYDNKVLIWKEQVDNVGNVEYVVIKEHLVHSASVNSISWAPHEYGLILACGSSDGKISILTYKAEDSWQSALIPAHSIGVNAVSWSPSATPGSLIQVSGSGPATAPIRLASGGCDNNVKIWRLDNSIWIEETCLTGHSDWIRDVSWMPIIGTGGSYIASCGQDKVVFVWSETNGEWKKNKLVGKEGFKDTCWRVSWSPSGGILAVSCGDNSVSMWKEGLDGNWGVVGDVVDAGKA